MVAEAAKTEPLPQPGDLDFQPSDLFQVPGGHAQELASAFEVGQRRQDAGHHGYAHALPPFQHPLPHAIQNFFQARLPDLVRNGCVAKCVTQDSGIGASVHWHTSDRERIPHHRFYARGEGVGVDATMGVQESSVNVEEIGVAVVPAKSIADGYEALSRRRLQPAGVLRH